MLPVSAAVLESVPRRVASAAVGLALASVLLAGAVQRPGHAWAATPQVSFPYGEGRCGPAELKYIEELPVLFVEGHPAQLGRQSAKLVGTPARQLVEYPRRLLAEIGLADRFPRLVAQGQRLLPQFPPQHLAELEAFAHTAGLDRDLLVGVNTMVDVYRGGLGCSSLLVEARRSKTGKPLFGRNLDFYSLGILQKYSLVIVCRPDGKHAFCSVGFPGMVGCLSGMNEAGLAVAVHEVLLAGDGAPLFDPRGVPYTLLLRRVLEECRTVDEAERLVRAAGRTTLFNLALCDSQQARVLEVTPRTVAVRRPERGLLACTNHFRSPELRTLLRFSWRYQALWESQALARLDVPDIAQKLHEVHQGPMTLQTMVFEPAAMRLHVAIGASPATALPLRTLDLRVLFRGKRSRHTPSAARPVENPGPGCPRGVWRDGARWSIIDADTANAPRRAGRQQGPPVRSASSTHNVKSLRRCSDECLAPINAP